MNEVSNVLDLKSIPCPLNVVKCKLALEKLKVDQTLLVNIDKGEPEEMVKKFLIEMNFCFKVIKEDQKSIKLKISYGSR